MNSQIIIRWSQGHATSNSNKYKLNIYVPQQKYRLGTVSNKLLGGGGLNFNFACKKGRVLSQNANILQFHFNF